MDAIASFRSNASRTQLLRASLLACIAFGLATVSGLGFCPAAGASEVVDIERDPRFEPAEARAGMSDPAKFKSGGLYLTAPVDASKDVILFVHGARGSPRDLTAVAEALDSSKQQAWFAYYATGSSIADSGQKLAADVLSLMKQHGITHLSVFAHSMGGLVAWQSITELQRSVDVRQFVSVNTPWDGSPSAQFGAWLSPSPLPIWIDLTPGSKALRAIRRHEIEARFTLVYTVTEDSSTSRGDGTISRRSQMVLEIERQATLVVKEIGTHISALHGPAAVRMSRLLSGAS